MKKRLGNTALVIVLLFIVNTTVSAQSGDRIQAEKLFVQAQRALSEGDDESAETLLKQALQKDGNFTSAIWQLATIYEKRGKLEYARELILRGLEQSPNANWAREKLSQLERTLTRKLLSEAESYMSTGQYGLAIPKLSLYMGIRPQDPEPLISLGRCHMALGNLAQASEYFKQALERDPTSSAIAGLLDEVNQRIEQSSLTSLVKEAQGILIDYSPDKREKAREVLMNILDIDPENSWANNKLGELDLLAAEQRRQEEKFQPVEKGKETVERLAEYVPSAPADFAKRHIYILLAAVVSAGLTLIIRRKGGKKLYPLEGSLTLIPVLDMVSLLNSNLKTGRLIVSTDDSKGEIFFEKGEIIHARWKSLDGKEAFHKLMLQSHGRYFFLNHLPNVRHTITEPLSLLLLSMKSREESPSRQKKEPSGREKDLSPVT